MPIFDRPVSGRETLSQLVFVLALHFVQHLDGSPPGHGQPVQTHCCSYLQPQRWPTSAHAMSRPGSDDSPGSSPLAAPAAASEDARAWKDRTWKKMSWKRRAPERRSQPLQRLTRPRRRKLAKNGKNDLWDPDEVDEGDLAGAD